MWYEPRPPSREQEDRPALYVPPAPAPVKKKEEKEPKRVIIIEL